MKTVALIFGGEGCEREISILSASELYSMLDCDRYKLIRVRIDPDGWYIVDGDRPVPTFPALLGGEGGLYLSGKILRIDLAIPILHGDLGEDGVIQGALTAAHVPFVGCGVLAGAVCTDKITAKLYAERLGIPTAKWIYASADDEATVAEAEKRLGYPVFVKPSGLGSSIGISRAQAADELRQALRSARALCDRVMLERAVDVDYEVECAFFDDGRVRIISAGGKIDSGGEAYDYEAKYEDISTAKISHGCGVCDKSALIEAYSERLAEAIGLRHIARLDYLVGRDGQIYFNEINTIPGMTPTSLYPSITEDAGLRKGEFIVRLIEAMTK